MTGSQYQHSSLNLGTKCRWRPDYLTPGKNASAIHYISGWVGPRSVKKEMFPLSSVEPRFLGLPVLTHATKVRKTIVSHVSRQLYTPLPFYLLLWTSAKPGPSSHIINWRCLRTGRWKKWLNPKEIIRENGGTAPPILNPSTRRMCSQLHTPASLP